MKTRHAGDYIRLCQQAQEAGRASESLDYANSVLQHARSDEHIQAGHLLQGMSWAMVDEPEESIASFRRLLEFGPNQVAEYYLGSVHASMGDLEQANLIFKRNIRIPLGPDHWTSTNTLRLGLDSYYEESDLPVSREVEIKADTAPGCEFVYFVCCDGKYLQLFTRDLVSSVAEHAPSNSCLHIHVINPTPADLEFAKGLKTSAEHGLSVAISSEMTEFPTLTANERKTYYSCARYLILPQLMARYDCPILMADTDQLVVADLQEVLQSLQGSDVKLLRFPLASFNLLSYFSASVTLLSNSGAAKLFARQLSDYVAWRMSVGSCFDWHLDQAAIAAVALTSEDCDISYFEPSVMASTGDGSMDYPPETIFWSVTYSISNNHTKVASLTKREENNQPKISIVIPVYNGANYMREAIDSALAQEWDNIEVVVVNDGSNDDGATDAIALSYGDRIVYEAQENGGVASALNKGISLMTGDVFCWLSHDDLHYPHKTKTQVDYWMSLGCPSAILYSDYTLIDAKGKKITEVVLDHAMLTNKPLYGLLRGSIHGCSIFVPKGLFDQFGGFDTALPTTQDYDLWARMIKSTLFIHMPEPLISSRWHDEQGSKKIEHEVEAATLWANIMEIPSPPERKKLEGSEYRYFLELAGFLDANGLTTAAEHASRRAQEIFDNTLVSVVVTVRDDIERTISAIESVLDQTHSQIELVVVDGSITPSLLLQDMATEHGERFTLVQEKSSDLAALRNIGCRIAKGAYIAFIEGGSLFLPEKVYEQLTAMLNRNLPISYTSHHRYHRNSSVLATIDSGVGAGAAALPQLVANGQVSAHTVMAEKNLWCDRLGFQERQHYGREAAAWLEAGSQGLLHALEDSLTIVRVES